MPNMQVSLTQIEKYGVIRPGSNVTIGAISISEIVEKPSAEQAPSNFAAVGRYVFGADVFEDLRKVKAGVGGEIQLTDAINAQAILGKVDAIEFFGQRYDCDSKFGYLEAIVDHALEHADYGEAFADPSSIALR